MIRQRITYDNSVFVIDRIVDSVGNIGFMQFAVEVKETRLLGI